MRCAFIHRVVSVCFASVSLFVLCVSPARAVFINEIHYDNVGADSGEAVELAGVAGRDLAGWSLVLYNGSTSSGAPYASHTLSGIFADDQNGMGVLGFSLSSLQNGAPDGIALVDDGGAVVQFLSYEGSFTATAGAANGLTSVDIGVAETSATPVGYSLALSGTGREYSDFSWGAAMPSSFGSINGEQFFAPRVSPVPSSTATVPVPPTGGILLLGILALVVFGRFSQRPPVSAAVG